MIIVFSLPRLYSPLKAFIDQRMARCLCMNGINATLYTDDKAQIAIYFLSRSLSYNYHDWETHFLLGMAYSQLKDYPNAKKAYLECLRLNLGYARAYYNLGNAYYYLKEYDNALQNYRDCIRIDDGFGQAYNNINVINKMRGGE